MNQSGEETRTKEAVNLVPPSLPPSPFSPPGLHEERRKRDAEAEVSRPLGCHTGVGVQDREYGCHLYREKERGLVVLIWACTGY
ncbi:hypothetical protein E2C01_055701 [Portunus trituberculatus]|uniref:Uncharacterized protein n=1 Tax=Portunus trituberculatus TaxID=210409 RepID=A0A5B7GXP1_PORTR|nr:hypothetical protein [Portunus trituberculatus]